MQIVTLRARAARHLAAVLGVAGVTAVGTLLGNHLDATAVALALLLVVLFVATVAGRGPGIVASVLGMLCFDFFSCAWEAFGSVRPGLMAPITALDVLLRLQHLGAAFDPSKVPVPALDGSQHSGFGVYLIQQSVDEARYFRDERGRNCITLIKARQAQAQLGT